ncbi:MFS transporter [Streptomyces incarnatus]|uniref:MFS transporter n=1 Tax=unclassified Streptomyces TaxID=2593676 RepID=UPI00119EA43E|nr:MULTISPECIES: MFS transporter [Streptomyces]QHC31941.1 MFS transporter [Streptomyces sp. HF10]WKE69075.1 MFS transporter [Streptomyces sp. WP-1]
MPTPSFSRAKWSIAALFCFLGFQYGTWVSRLPALKARLDLGAGEVGLLLMACGAGAAAAFPLVAVLMRRLGSRTLSLASALALIVVLAALSVVPNYPLALLAVCADGVAVGCLNVAMNAQGAALESSYDRTAMSQLHATFSAGLLTAALLTSGVTSLTPSVPAHFAVAGAVLLLLPVCARRGLLPDAPAPTETATATAATGKQRTRRRSLPSGLTLLMGCAMTFGTITEGAMNDWSTLYLKDTVKASSTVAPLGIAVVSATMLLARACADRWRDRWGDGPVVRAGSALAAAGLGLALLTGGVPATLLGFACVGLGAAAITPCVYVAAAERGSDALSLVAAMGTTGLLAGPALIGFVATAGGLTLGMAVVAASALAVTATAIRIPWNIRSTPEPQMSPLPSMTDDNREGSAA